VADFFCAVFEDKALADQAVVAVEKVVHHEDMEPVSKGAEVGHAEIVEQAGEKGSNV
jgi:hypothetical protein